MEVYEEVKVTYKVELCTILYIVDVCNILAHYRHQ